MLADVEGFGAVFEVREEMCELQAGLVCMILMGLFLYTVVLVVSLFRIFNKVNVPPCPCLATSYIEADRLCHSMARGRSI